MSHVQFFLKRHIRLGIFFGLIAFLVTAGFGCQGLSSQQQAAIKPVSLEYWTVFDDVDELQALVDSYKSVRPYITVNIRKLSSGEVYQRLVEALAEDSGPDILSISNRWLGKFQSKLAPMPPSVNDTTVVVTKGTLSTTTNVNSFSRSTVTLDQLDSEFVQTVKKDVVSGSSIYGLPLSLDTMAIYYNKDLLDAAGVAEPPKTWTEFQAAVKKITRFDKTSNQIVQAGTALGTGSNIPGSDDILALLFKQSGLDMVNRNGQVIFNNLASNVSRSANTPVMSVLNFYTDFANPSRDTYTWNTAMDNALNAFVSGKVAFFFGYSYHNAVIRARAPQLNYRILPLLQLNPDHPVNVANYWIQTVVAKSKHQNEAWGLITYLAHSPATKEYLTKTGRPTALRAYITDQQANPDLAPFVSQVLVADNWYRGHDYEGAVRALNDLVEQWLQPPANATDPNQLNVWRNELLDRAAQRINQTL